MVRRVAWLGVLLLVPVLVQAEMPPEASIRGVAEAWLAKKPAPG